MCIKIGKLPSKKTRSMFEMVDMKAIQVLGKRGFLNELFGRQLANRTARTKGPLPASFCKTHPTR
jgi:hypothetical protein